MGRHLARKLLLGGHRGCTPICRATRRPQFTVLMRSLDTTRSIAQGARNKRKSEWAMRHNESFTCHSQGGPP
jgi:hypothetical protein